MAGSVLKSLKNDLQKHNLLRNQQGKKSQRRNQDKDRRQKDQNALSAIREAFNPFDMKHTRQKHEIVGGKNVIGQKGRPGMAKQSGEEQRKATYEAQKRLKNREGGVLDRRFGENDKTMSAEDKMVARYARERISQTKRSKNSFSLDDNDTETLTHSGQALSFQDDFAEDDLMDESEAKRRRLDSEEGFQGHGAPEDSNDGRPKSKHDVMQEIIQKSKMHKLIRQKAQEAQENRVESMNAPDEFDALMADLKQFDRQNRPERPETTDVDAAYDQAVREMQFDRRAVPEDRTKTEEEIEKEAREKRAEQEKARQLRMEGQGDDLDVEEIGNDAELFGLKGNADDNEDNEEYEDYEAEVATSLPTTLKALHVEVAGDEISAIKQMIKKVDPKLGETNKQKLRQFSVVLCKYACTVKDSSKFNSMMEILRPLSQKYEETFGKHFRQSLRELHDKVSANNTKFSRQDLVLLTMIPVLFSTSDQWHLVANMATLIITMHLSKSMDMSASAVATSLYLCDLLLVYQRISKRYIPEVTGYFVRVLSAVEGVDSASKLVRTSKAVISLDETEFAKAKPQTMALSRLQAVKASEAILRLACTVDRAAKLWKGLVSYVDIFSPICALLEQLPTNEKVKDISSRLGKSLKFATQDRAPLQLQQIRPVGILTHAPEFEENFNPDVKNYDDDPHRREMQKLRSQFKKERKQTLKEIRRDSEFVSREKLQETRTQQKAYHEMLARVTNQINTEEGADKNRYEREKRKRR